MGGVNDTVREMLLSARLFQKIPRPFAARWSCAAGGVTSRRRACGWPAPLVSARASPPVRACACPSLPIGWRLGWRRSCLLGPELAVELRLAVPLEKYQLPYLAFPFGRVLRAPIDLTVLCFQFSRGSTKKNSSGNNVLMDAFGIEFLFY